MDPCSPVERKAPAVSPVVSYSSVTELKCGLVDRGIDEAPALQTVGLLGSRLGEQEALPVKYVAA
jgi:hypothetical protein